VRVDKYEIGQIIKEIRQTLGVSMDKFDKLLSEMKEISVEDDLHLNRMVQLIAENLTSPSNADHF